MSDPVRLRWSDETGPFERGLLEAGAEERMSDAKKHALAASVVAAGALGASSTLAKAWWSTGTFKIALGLAGVALLVGGTARAVGSPRATTLAPPAPVIFAAPTTVASPPVPATVVAPAPPPAPRGVPARVAPSVVASALPEHDLAAEARMLELARDALARSDPSGALTIVDRHDATFPRAELVDEARVLRVEALAAKGDLAAARALGEPWLAGHPRSPYAARVRRAIGGAP